MLGGKSVERILSMRLCLGTVSKALLMSMVARTERSGGSSLLNPSRIYWVRVVRWVVVEWEARKPC